MNTGIDIGYSHTKATAGTDRNITFPSVVGTPDKARFSLTTTPTSIILIEPYHVQIGDGAISQSRFLHRREDRHWIESDEWYQLFLSAMTELSTGSPEVTITTGLPVAFYSDRATVRDRLLGVHRVQREERRAQRLTVTACYVVPQPYGALLAACLNDQGRITDTELATGAVGVIDVGGKTTNLLSVNALSEIGRETASASTGAWDAVRHVRDWLTDHCPELELRDHQVIDAIIARKVKYFGDPIDLSEPINAALEPLADQVIAEATQLWNGAAALDRIIVSGGGALLLGPYITRHFRHAQIAEDPVFANALGFWRFCQYKGRR